jgi:hypothetical protein
LTFLLPGIDRIEPEVQGKQKFSVNFGKTEKLEKTSALIDVECSHPLVEARLGFHP